jgi:hypothetical protein
MRSFAFRVRGPGLWGAWRDDRARLAKAKSELPEEPLALSHFKMEVEALDEKGGEGFAIP